MPTQPPDYQSSLRQLYDDNWLVRTTAARLLKDFPETTLPVIARFFELTLDDHAPLREMCRIAFENMKSAAVPFLLAQAQGTDSARRDKAIQLLSLAGQCAVVWAARSVPGPTRTLGNLG
jgi:hypothetical protein